MRYLLLTLCLSNFLHAQQPSNCRALIETLAETKNPVSCLTFKQRTTFYKADTVVMEQSWWEALRFPNRLHIRFGDYEAGNALIFKDGWRYFFKNGKEVRRQYKHHELLLFSSGLRQNPIDSSMKYLAAFGIDTNTVVQAEIDGRLCYGIGAPSLSEEKNQLWIDAEKLYFKRSKLFIDGHWQEVDFSDWQPLAEGQYIETTVRIWLDGALYMVEKYEDLATPEQLPDTVFEAEQFEQSDWR